MQKVVATCLVGIATLLAATTKAAEPAEGEAAWVFVENDQLRVGLLRSHGGAIGHLSDQRDGRNMLDHFDHGRMIQQSYYGDTDGSMWAEQPWRYNPVQGGGYRGEPAEVVELVAGDATALVTTVPRHWATGRRLPECTMQQRLILKGPILEVQYRFDYRGAKTHVARHQETPAVFLAPRLHTFVTYAGEAAWQGQPLTQWIPGWPNEAATLSENWAAYVGDDGVGLGVLVPGVTEATCYRFAAAGAACSYVAPVQTFALTPDLIFTYTAYFTIGDANTIRERFALLRGAEK